MKTATIAAALVLGILLGLLGYAGYFDRSYLVEVPATAQPIASRRQLAVVYFSGDVGYKAGMGGMIGSRLVADGIPVIAVDSLAFFRTHKTVLQVTALTAEAMRQALAFGHASQVILIGHSLGGDAMQAGLKDLPQDLRRKLRAVILIVPTKDLFLHISPAEMLDLGTPDSPVLPSLKRIDWVPLTCIHGAEEADSPCAQLSLPNARNVRLPGGHALHWDIDRVHREVLRAIDQAATKVTEVSESDNLRAMRQGA